MAIADRLQLPGRASLTPKANVETAYGRRLRRRLAGGLPPLAITLRNGSGRERTRRSARPPSHRLTSPGAGRTDRRATGRGPPPALSSPGTEEDRARSGSGRHAR